METTDVANPRWCTLLLLAFCCHAAMLPCCTVCLRHCKPFLLSEVGTCNVGGNSGVQSGSSSSSSSISSSSSSRSSSY